MHEDFASAHMLKHEQHTLTDFFSGLRATPALVHTSNFFVAASESSDAWQGMPEIIKP